LRISASTGLLHNPWNMEIPQSHAITSYIIPRFHLRGGLFMRCKGITQACLISSRKQESMGKRGNIHISEPSAPAQLGFGHPTFTEFCFHYATYATYMVHNSLNTSNRSSMRALARRTTKSSSCLSKWQQDQNSSCKFQWNSGGIALLNGSWHWDQMRLDGPFISPAKPFRRLTS